MEPVYILNQQQLDELKSASPSQLLRDTNATLKRKLDELSNQPSTQSVQPSSSGPYQVIDGKLSPTSSADFVAVFNTIATRYATLLKDSDKLVFDYFTDLAQVHGCESYFAAVVDVKRYRVSLQKKQLYLPKSGKLILQEH